MRRKTKASKRDIKRRRIEAAGGGGGEEQENNGSDGHIHSRPVDEPNVSDKKDDEPEEKAGSKEPGNKSEKTNTGPKKKVTRGKRKSKELEEYSDIDEDAPHEALATSMYERYLKRIRNKEIGVPVYKRLQQYFLPQNEVLDRRSLFKSERVLERMSHKDLEKLLDEAEALRNSATEEFEDAGIDVDLALHLQMTASYISSHLRVLEYPEKFEDSRRDYRQLQLQIFDTSALRAVCVLVEEYIREKLLESKNCSSQNDSDDGNQHSSSGQHSAVD